jgi:hypothetical protein
MKTSKNQKGSVNMLRKLFLALVIGSTLSCSQYIPWETLDGKILKDEEGNIVKLEWQSGYGESWRFLYPREMYQNGDTVIVWEYYR